MSYFRSYFSKNNTILKDSFVNTSKNPNTELFYGSGTSKFIFKIDIDDLKSRIDNGEYVLDENTKHYLTLTNTIFGDESFLSQKNGKGRKRSSSFDLILFPITEYWDEGNGFDYDQSFDYIAENETYILTVSNWYKRTEIEEWTEVGVFEIEPETILSTIHFDNGNENIREDITDYVNGLLTGSTTNYGLGLCFSPVYLDTTKTVEESVAFFTKYTQTFFEPYLETQFEDLIEDDRDNFIVDRENSLYLYVTKGKNFYDLDELPTVTILDKNSTPISGTVLTTTKIKKGIYKVDVTISGDLCQTKKFFIDQWSNVIIDGIEIDPVKQKFVPKQPEEEYSFGENPVEYDNYILQYQGIRLNEKVKRGEKRKIVVTLKSMNGEVNGSSEIYYRIYLKEGRTQVNVFDWTRFDRTNENSLILDTSFMIPREYWLEIKGKHFNEEIFYDEEIKFEIVSER